MTCSLEVTITKYLKSYLQMMISRIFLCPWFGKCQCLSIILYMCRSVRIDWLVYKLINCCHEINVKCGNCIVLTIDLMLHLKLVSSNWMWNMFLVTYVTQQNIFWANHKCNAIVECNQMYRQKFPRLTKNQLIELKAFLLFIS